MPSDTRLLCRLGGEEVEHLLQENIWGLELFAFVVNHEIILLIQGVALLVTRLKATGAGVGAGPTLHITDKSVDPTLPITEDARDPTLHITVDTTVTQNHLILLTIVVAGLTLDLYLHIVGVIGPTLQMTVTTEEAVTMTILLIIIGVIVPILQRTVTIEEAATVTTLLKAVIFRTLQMFVLLERAAIVTTLRTTVTIIEGVDIVPFLVAFHLNIGEATHAVYHLGGQRGAIQEVFPGIVALVVVTLLIRRKALRGVAVLVHLPDLFQGLLHLGLRLHREMDYTIREV